MLCYCECCVIVNAVLLLMLCYSEGHSAEAEGSVGSRAAGVGKCEAGEHEVGVCEQCGAFL
jgi:hypothetical protein